MLSHQEAFALAVLCLETPPDQPLLVLLGSAEVTSSGKLSRPLMAAPCQWGWVHSPSPAGSYPGFC